MRANRSIIMIITALFLLTGFLPLIPAASAEPTTRADPDYEGTLTTDLTLGRGTYTFDDLLVPREITLTLELGAVLTPYTDAYLYVQGTLIIKKSSPVSATFGSPTGNNWEGIRVSGYGNAMMENFSMYKATRGIYVEGMGTTSTIKNGSIIGSDEGIYYHNLNAKQTLENVLLSSISTYGLRVDNSIANISISKVSMRYLVGTGIAIQDSNNVNFKGITIMQTQSYCFYVINSHNITLNGFTFNDNTSLHETAGFFFLGEVNDITVNNGAIEGVNFAFAFATQPGNRINISNVRTGSKVADVMVNTVSQTTGDIYFIDCDLDSAKNTTRLNANSYDFTITFINTTWNSIRPISVPNLGSVKIFWYLEGEVVNGNGERITSQLVLNPGPIYQTGTYEIPNGYLPKTIIEGGSVTNRGTTKPTNRFMFQSTDLPVNSYTTGLIYIDQYTFWTIMLDLNPIHTLPATMDVDEDQWLDIDLYDHFDDPEGEDLEYNITTSDNITLERNGGLTNGEIKIKNRVKDWFGTGWMEIKATDPANNFTRANVTINVLPINDAPYFKTPLPAPVIDEDGWTWLNLTGKIADAENDDISVSFPESPKYVLDWDEEKLNLTITPAANFNGLLEIEINLTDGSAWMTDILYVIVRSINDPPEFTIRYRNSDEVGMGEHPQPEGPPLAVYLFEIDEDTSVSFTVDATDVDNTTLTYIIDPAQLMHGALDVDPLNLQNFTYTPFTNDFAGDLVRIVVSDGEVSIIKWIWFKVSAVNDDPVFDAPDPWEVDVEIGIQFDLDIGGMISDVDGDNLTITVDPSTYITVSGTTLEILVTDTYKETSMAITVTVSDGTVDVVMTLTLFMENWVETFIDTWEIDPKTDMWKIEVAAEEGLDLFLVVEDAGGNLTSYPMVYDEDGMYTAEIPEDVGMEGHSYWISEEEDGEPISTSYEEALPALKEKNDTNFPWWIIILIVIVIVLAAIILYFVFARGGGYGGEVGDIEDEE